MEKAETVEDLPTEDIHDLGVVSEQLLVSLRIFEELPTSFQKDAGLAELTEQVGMLKDVVEDIFNRKALIAVSEMKTGTRFLRSKFVKSKTFNLE